MNIVYQRLRKGATMGIFGKSTSFLWALILIVSSTNNSRVFGQLIIEVTNALDNGSLDLTVACPNIDGKSYLLHPGGFHEWINNGAVTESGGPPFLCSFQWKGASHMFNMYVPSRDNDCEECHWYAKETGPCRVYNRPNKPTICSNWD
ncbi:hypothetical protein VNO80_07683 [Phaseolus coccineus]|uniref:S-protein homolog n=1 Tax=Phaseolus coccineus TaxID=3886 RepID=A0AAN9RFK4_PHACN